MNLSMSLKKKLKWKSDALLRIKNRLKRMNVGGVFYDSSLIVKYLVWQKLC